MFQYKPPKPKCIPEELKVDTRKKEEKKKWRQSPFDRPYEVEFTHKFVHNELVNEVKESIAATFGKDVQCRNLSFDYASAKFTIKVSKNSCGKVLSTKTYTAITPCTTIMKDITATIVKAGKR